MVNGAPAWAPIWPAQAPAALMTHWQPISRSSPAHSSRTRTAVMRRWGSYSKPTTGWRTSTLAPRALAPSAIDQSSFHASMPPSVGMRKTRSMRSVSLGSARLASAGVASWQGTPVAAQPSTKRSA
jgi:hypothetical protein